MSKIELHGNEIFLIDANILIAAKNLYYNPKFCSIFWVKWLKTGIDTGKLRSIDKVKAELEDKNSEDFLSKKVEDGFFDNFWISTQDIVIVNHYKKLQNWANNEWVKNKPLDKCQTALENFAQFENADPWLLSLAMSNKDYVIVTNEISAPNSTKNIKIPDAANADNFNIKVCNLYDLLNKHSYENQDFCFIN